MGTAYFFYWIDDKKFSRCPDKIRDFINSNNYLEDDFKISYGATNNLKDPLEEIIKTSNEVFFFPAITITTDENIEILEDVINFITEYTKGGKLIHILPLIFVRSSILSKGLRTAIDSYGRSKDIKRVILVTDKFRTNVDVNLPHDWLVIFRNFVELVYAYRNSYDLRLNEIQGIACFGSFSIELPIRQTIDRIFVELFKEFKEDQLKSDTSSFNFGFTQVTTTFEAEINKKFQGYQVPLICNHFQREPEVFFYLLPERKIEEIKESDYEPKLQAESTAIVENLFKKIYNSVVKFSGDRSLSIGKSFEPFRKEILQKIRDAIVQFFNTGGTLYTLEKWLNAALENVTQSFKQETSIFQPEKIIENRKLFFDPDLKELCRILLKLKYREKFLSYKYILSGIFVFLSLLSLITVPNALHFSLTLKNTTALLTISAILSLILTFIIRFVVLQHFRKKANQKLEELAKKFDRLKKEFSDTLIKMFQDFAIFHFMTKINIFIRRILIDIQETCFIYRKVFERKEITPFSIGQSQLIRYCKGKSIPDEEIENRTKEYFNQNINSIFVNFLNIASEFELESCIANFLQCAEGKIMEYYRSSLKSDNFDLAEGDLRRLIEETENYITCLILSGFEKEENVSVDRFLCLPRGIKVDIPGIMHLHSTNWDKNESILSAIIVSNIKNIGSKRDGNKKSD